MLKKLLVAIGKPFYFLLSKLIFAITLLAKIKIPDFKKIFKLATLRISLFDESIDLKFKALELKIKSFVKNLKSKSKRKFKSKSKLLPIGLVLAFIFLSFYFLILKD
ncbi:MAG TPA: hypothetical protein VL401_00590, partial [Alphaproteobacteria bacterium]|nr:hypothetical protein [Alphaproteobacteria bacterium]